MQNDKKQYDEIMEFVLYILSKLIWNSHRFISYECCVRPRKQGFWHYFYSASCKNEAYDIQFYLYVHFYRPLLFVRL